MTLAPVKHAHLQEFTIGGYNRTVYCGAESGTAVSQIDNVTCPTCLLRALDESNGRTQHLLERVAAVSCNFEMYSTRQGD